MHWNHGYNTDLGYTFGYYREQDPAWMDLCALRAGHRPPEGKRRYLELGCGQGVNLCLIAACHSDIEFVGIDFNPAHIAHAQQLAASAGLKNVRFIEGDFAALGRAWPAELGQFHYASAHGILSWIARPVRDGLYACLDAALLPGGLFYASYNILPGWLSTLPVQHLLRLWQVREGLDSLAAIDQGRERLLKLIEANSAMARVLPALRARLDKFPQLDKNYLVQEYLHDVWTCFWFDQIHEELSPHKLDYLGTATAGDWYLPAMLPPEWRSLLQTYRDRVEIEVMIDVLVNQSFRRDLWRKGHHPLWAGEQLERLNAVRFALLNRPSSQGEDNPYKFTTSAGEVQGRPEVYGPLYDALAQGPKTLAELKAVPGAQGAVRTVGDTVQALSMMLQAGHVTLVRAVDAKPAKALNRALAHAVLKGAPYRYVIASAIPHVIGASEIDLMLLALHQGEARAKAEPLAQALTEHLVALGKGLIKDGQPLNTRETLEPRARELASAFLTQTLPNWQRLGVV